MAQPTRKRGCERTHDVGAHVDESRRAGAAVEIFVSASHRKFRVAPRQIDRQRPGAVGKIPQHDRTGGMGLCRDRIHVVHPAGAVVDLRQHHHRHIRRYRVGDILGRHDLEVQPTAQLLYKALRHIEVRWEVAAVG